MLNQCSFIGNLGADPEIRSTNSGKKIANLRIAVTEKWTAKSGERQERTEWVRITIFSEGLANVAEKYLRKGSKIFIQGKMQTRKWTDQSGQDKYSTEIIIDGFNGILEMLDSKPGGNNDSQPERQQRDTYNQGFRQPATNSGGNGGVYEDLDDDVDSIPF